MKKLQIWAAAGLLIAATLIPGRAESSEISDLILKMETHVQKMMEEGRVPSASVAVVMDGRIAWTAAFGDSNIWARTKACPETVYLIGSTFKTMSTTALLQLMEQGKFRLDEAVNSYLDEFKIRGEDPDNPVTFRHLLTHTSGLPGDFGPHSVWGDSVPSPLKVYLEKKLVLKHPTFSKTEYSNMAYTLIGYLVEKFSGIPFKKYIRERIFRPLEMKDTDFHPRQDMEERLSIPYLYNQKTGRHIPAVRKKADVWPAGIVYGTISDLAKWLIFNLNRGENNGMRLIQEKTFQEMMTVQYPRHRGRMRGWLNETTGFGLTWWISRQDGDLLFAHSGSVDGYTAFIVGNLDQRIGFAVLTNGNQAHQHLFQLALTVLELVKTDRSTSNGR